VERKVETLLTASSDPKLRGGVREEEGKAAGYGLGENEKVLERFMS